MADEEHLRILQQGVDAWHRWREEHPDIRPDLSGVNLRLSDLNEVNLYQADLRGTDLSGTDLRLADLTEADLSEADLRAADLTGANLSTVNLIQANLSGAKLGSTNLGGADLYEANLNGAKLRGTDFSGAYLDGADLSEATVAGAFFGNVDLSQAKGLEFMKHEGPSTIGIDTLYLSKGQIPESFLRGAGVPDEFITYARSLINRPIEFYSCFISYSSRDQDFAERLHADLQEKGVRCWFAPEDMKIGDKIWDRLDQSIRLHDKLLLVLSAHSIGSEWVEDEVTTAFEEERRRGKTVLFPVRVDDMIFGTEESWAARVRQRHIGDFHWWKDHDAYQKAFTRLLRDLKAEAGG